MLIRFFKYACVFFLLLLNGMLLSQNEASKWYFGNSAGLNFMTNPPTALTNGVMGAYEGCSAVADASGNMLLYSNGLVVLNRLNQVMANGGGLAGDISSAQSCLIVKQPGNTNIYYIFTTHQFGASTHSLSYSVVDMNLAAGNGSVTVKNVQLFANSSEKLTAVKHCNGIDFWIITQDRLSNSFRAYLFTASGVNSTPIISSTGGIDSGSGYLKASPSGRRLGMTNYYDATFTGNPAPFSFALFDFDNTSGIVSNPLDLGTYSLSYGCEFSPDETKLYAATLYSIYQWNLCAGTGTAVVASNNHVFALVDTISFLGALQRGPDGKIYVSRWQEKNLGVINNPNLAGSNCNYVDTSQSIAPKTASGGLPNFMPLFKPALPTFSTTVNAAISCNTASFNATALVNCPFSGYISTMSWNFDDPGSGSANSSSLSIVTHTYNNPGVYNVRLVLYNPCGIVIDTLKQQVSILHIPISAAAGFSLCAGKTLTLSAAGGFTNYLWSNGGTTGTIAVSPTVNTAYTLTATDVYGCNYQSVQTLTVSPLPPVAIAGNTLVCQGSAITQTASGALHYSWTTGDTTSVVSITPGPGTVYTVTGTGANGCTGMATTSITVTETPSLTAGNATVCSGNAATLIATNNNHSQNLSYLWMPGATSGSAVVVNETSTRVYTVTGSINGCSASATTTLTVIIPGLTVIPSLTIMPGSSVTLQAGGADSYSWNPPDYLSCVDCSNPVASPPNDMSYCVTALQGACTFTDCLNIIVSCQVTGDFSLPNAFTPNGDRDNDEFCLLGWECTNNFNIKIFDRWGEKVFESKDPSFCWDGFYKGKLLDAAVFTYMVSAKKNNEPITKKGNITLLR